MEALNYDRESPSGGAIADTRSIVTKDIHAGVRAVGEPCEVVGESQKPTRQIT